MAGARTHMMGNGPAALSARVDNIPAAEWRAVTAQFADIHYEQTDVYGASHDNEQQSQFLLSRDGEAVAGTRVGIFKLPVLNRGLALVRFGPFWRQAGRPVDFECYRAVIGALMEEYCVRRKLYLVVRPRAHPEIYPKEAAVLAELGLHEGDTSALDRYLVDVSLSEDEQMKSLDQGWRAKLRKGLKHGVEIRMCDDAAGAATFSEPYAQMVGRKKLNYAGLERADVIPELMQLPEGMKLHIAIAYLGSKPIGGATFAVVGDVAYYVFGASSADALTVNGGYLLQWQIMAWLRGTGVRWYELGGQGDAGIQQFKKGLAGKRGMLLPVREFHYSPDMMASALVASLFKLRDLRDRMREWQRERGAGDTRAA